jgi:pyruvate dehydrogenase E1 component alpha subunit
MPRKTVYQAQIDYLQILDEDGKLDAKLAKDTLTDEQVVYLYEQMTICRQLRRDRLQAPALRAHGHLPAEQGAGGQRRGGGVGALKGKDWFVPCYRENAALFMHGLPMHYVLLHWMGDERGNQIPEGVPT